MFKPKDYVVYKREVCQVKEIKEKYINNTDYYILEPINDNTLKINVPVNNNNNFLRNLITKDKVEQIISKIPKVNIINKNEKGIELEYKKLLKSNDYIDLIKIIKTTYLRNKERINNNKKIGEKDNNYFELAEKYLYTEFGIVLNLSYEETKKYVIKEIEKLQKKS